MEKQLLKRISSLEKKVVDLYHKVKQQLVGPQGPQGVEGPQGPQGALGPVGPAGLEWQGLWNEDTSYAQDDAVGYAGASWFCISAVTGTNNDSPDNDTDHWALLAAQGAQGQDGAPGVQGPQGPQGPSGVAPIKTQGIVYGDSESYFTQTVLPYDMNLVYDGEESSSFKLPNTTAVGKEVIVDVRGTNCRFYGFNGELAFELAVNSSGSQIIASYNDLIKFISLGNNYWIVEYLPRVYPTLNGKNLVTQNAVYTFTTSNTTSPLSLSALNASYPNSSTMYDFKVFCPNITGGGLVYIKTGVSTWVSQSITTVT